MRNFLMEDWIVIEPWFRHYGWTLSLEDLPIVGLIVPGIAAAFLVQTDTTYCFLEPFIANPDTSKEARAEVLRELMKGLVKEAKSKGFKHVFGFSTVSNLINISEELGFKKDSRQYSMVTLET